jgi:pilus assembly protein FimV
MATNAFRLIVPVLLGAFMLLFPSDGLRALGLGEARVDSWLGQPLDVSIRLLAAEDENVESLSVGPAALADFERLGVPSESLGLGLEVTVDRSVEPARVRVRSRQPANDPVVQILIDARWSNGRVLREYTLFLDPPTVESSPPVRRVDGEQAPAPTPTRPGEAAESRSQPAERSAPEAPQTGREPASDRFSQDTVTVAPGDTLWRIASEWRPDSSLSMDQVMLAIFNRNRDAFLGENINRLRSDTRLDMPAIDDVRGVDRAEAERRVREQMNAWQSGFASETPEVSEAAMPEAEPERESATTSTSGEQDTAHRLDVVPLEDEPSDEGSAVSDGEIRRVRGELTEIEDEIFAGGLERQEFDDRIAEIHDALDQSDLAGLAVAQESLAELQERLREVREAEAAQDDALADTGNGETEEVNRVDEYMRELRGQFADDAADSDASEQTPDAVADAAEETGDVARNERVSTEASADDSLPGWLLPAVGILVLILILAVVMFWLRGWRAAEDEPQAGEAKAGAVKSARSRVARHPSDLAAHLALLQVLADRGQTEAFTDAFDRMYQQVDDESDPNWQEAVSLAAAHAPDHPLLTPQETSAGDEGDEFDRRADEMIGMLEADSDEEDEADQEQPSMDEGYDLSGESEADEDEVDHPVPEAGIEDGGEDEDALSDDMDLAVLSERVDDPSTEPGQDRSFDRDDGELDFAGYEEDDGSSEAEPASSPDEPTEELPDKAAPDLDLDLGPARDQEADEIFGESGTRDEEDLDLEFTSDVEGDPELTTEGSLDFELDETPEAHGDDDSAGAEAEEMAESESAEPAASGDEASSLSGDEASSLSDEDADVKLDLARAYISVDLGDSARSVLEEVVSEGSADKRAEAQKLLDDL